MDAKSQRPKGRRGALSTLSVAVDALNVAKDISCIAPAQAAFSAVSVLLTMIRDCMANEQDYVELGLNCADICRALDRGMNGRKLDDLGRSVREAIDQLTTTVAEIQKEVIKQSGRNQVSRILRSRNDKDMIASWRIELNRILHVFNTELAINTHATVSDMRNDVSKIREEMSGQIRSTQTSVPGEAPPPAPRACFGRDELIENIVGLAENLTPIALIGAGGIGKTSIALTVLHHRRIKERFGDNRRFIRCDQFPASRFNFLSRLSTVIGARVKNPEDLAPLRQLLSSKEMLIVLDNAESILDPLGADAQEIYGVVEELSQFGNICLAITSRITTIPPDCETLEVPTLSEQAALDTFYRIYKYGGQSESANDILKQLDFHPLSVTLLAAVAHQNKWDNDRLVTEWEQRQTNMLQTEHKMSLATTIELSLSSPMFRELGPDARGILGIVAFFPQGVDENNLSWLIPTISNRTSIFDKLRILSLTYRSNGFITMLAPIRDYLRPSNPKSSLLLCTAKERYFTRMSIKPESSTFGESRWITSEDANVEHLLGVFASIDSNSHDVWDACINFMRLLYRHKRRQTVLIPRIEGLPDDHHSKPQCLFQVARLFESVGNHSERKRLLTHTLKLERGRGNDDRVAYSLKELSDANRVLNLREEGLKQAKEALEIYKRLGKTVEQAKCLIALARVLHDDEQLDAAEEAISRAIELFPDKGEELRVCRSHRILGDIYRSKGEREKAIHHYDVALGMASPSNWSHHLFLIHFSLALLFVDEGEFEDALAHVEQAKPHAVHDLYHLGRATLLQARIWYLQRKYEEATSEALHALDIFEKLGSTGSVETCEDLLRDIAQCRSTSGELGPSVCGTPSSTLVNAPQETEHES